MPRNDLIQVRSDTSSNWTSVNPILAIGEIGFETNTGKFKIGTGSTAWSSLTYASGTTSSATTNASLLTSGTLDNARLPAVATTITTVGTLGSLEVTNGVTAATFSGSGASLTLIPYSALTGTVPTWNQSTTGNATTVTTNANLTGDVTSVGNATTLTNAPVIAKLLTGYVSGSGTVAATDSILQAVQKLNGNNALKANIASPTFTSTVAVTGGALGTTAGNELIVSTISSTNANTDNVRTKYRRVSGGTDWTSAQAKIQRTIDGTDMGYVAFGGTSAYDVRIGSGTTDIATFVNSGNVGIGTSSPTTALDVSGTITATSYTGALASATTAVTQTAADSSTKVATTAFVTTAITNKFTAWTAFTPSFTGVTAGSGASNTGQYCLVDKVLFIRVKYVLGTGGSFTNPVMTLPASLVATGSPTTTWTNSMQAIMTDLFVNSYPLSVLLSTTTTISFYVQTASGTYLSTVTAVSATIPFTSAGTDWLEVSGWIQVN